MTSPSTAGCHRENISLTLRDRDERGQNIFYVACVRTKQANFSEKPPISAGYDGRGGRAHGQENGDVLPARWRCARATRCASADPSLMPVTPGKAHSFLQNARPGSISDWLLAWVSHACACSLRTDLFPSPA